MPLVDHTTLESRKLHEGKANIKSVSIRAHLAGNRERIRSSASTLYLACTLLGMYYVERSRGIDGVRRYEIAPLSAIPVGMSLRDGPVMTFRK